MDAVFTKSLISPEPGAGDDDEEGSLKSGLLVDSKMISLDSTSGRPSFEELVEANSPTNGEYSSTGIYLCGPEKMIESCKKAAGMGCQVAAERLQMLMKGNNKFVFYEEKFEW